MESNRNVMDWFSRYVLIIRGVQNGVKPQQFFIYYYVDANYKGGAKWSQTATSRSRWFAENKL